MSSEPMTTAQIWELFGARLRAFLLQRVSDEQAAEDLLQETFVRIHSKLGDLDDARRISAWVFQIARNLTIDHYRSKSRDAAAIANNLEDRVDDEENLNDLVVGWLPAMIAELPTSYRETIELYEIEGVTQQEIADRLGISLSGAKSRVQRGREKLKALLLDCCSFEQDRRGNLIGYTKNNADDNCNDSYEC